MERNADAGRRVEDADFVFGRQLIDGVIPSCDVLGERRTIGGLRNHPTLRLFDMQRVPAIKLGEERFGYEVLAAGRFLLVVDRNKY